MPVYGSRDGIDRRLDDWAERLAKDKRFPWAGTGLLADLKAAAAEIRGEPDDDDEFAAFQKPEMEFDL